MSTPTAVVFDLGKVLVDFDYGLAARKIAALSDRSPEEIQAIIDHSPLLFRFESSRMTPEEFFNEVRQLCGYRGSFADFSASFADIFSPIPQMIELQGKLRARDVPTFIFSNTNDLAIQHIRRKFPFFGGFTDYILSYQHGSMKPDAPLYEVVERLVGCDPSGLLYLDDRIENVEAGKARGWQVIHHQEPAESIAMIAKCKLLG